MQLLDMDLLENARVAHSARHEMERAVFAVEGWRKRWGSGERK